MSRRRLIGMRENGTPALLPARAEMERAFASKDSSYDGLFYVAVTTTGIFCRPSCPSRAARENIEFFGSVKECLAAGYRACKRCRPLEMAGNEAHLDDAIRAGGNESESHRGFREAFARAFGESPSRIPTNGNCIVTGLFESPLGPLLAGVNNNGICLLEFINPREMEHRREMLQRQFDGPVVSGEHRLLAQLRLELVEYFSTKRLEFNVPVVFRGTDFQEKVWRELCRIPCGETIAYEELARRIGQPTAQRAVASANRLNRVCILIPCHRVIGKDGTLTGYGGGLWRKRLLLELERSGRVIESSP